MAIARALIMEPKLIFADEPTGNLDSSNGEVVMQLLEEIVKTKNTTVIYVTHDHDYANRATSQIELVDGKIHRISPELFVEDGAGLCSNRCQ